jgi:hypothetical protein
VLDPPLKKLSIRKRLPHDVPLWIDRAKECYFITISCKWRGRNQLAFPDVARTLFNTILHRNDKGDWYVHLGLLMPDHLHFLASFPQTEKGLQTIVSKWKEWTAKAIEFRGSAISSSIGLGRMKVFVKRRITSF